MDIEDTDEMRPPPTYNISIICLVVGCLFVGLQLHSLFTKNTVEVTSLFIIPGLFLLGVIGLINPVIPSSLQPGAQGYPTYAKPVAIGCWVVSAVVGGVLCWFIT
jgi:hypothetical protein